MKIKETYNDFTNFIFVGFNTYHVVCDKNGVEMTVDELVERSKFHHRVYFLGETNNYMPEITEFAKKIQKNNEKMLIQVYCDGVSFDSKLARCENVIFIVVPEMSGKPYEERIKMDSLKKYAKNEAFFVFAISSGDDIDRVTSIIAESGIEAYSVFFMSIEDNIKNSCIEQAKNIGANVIC
jgi:hypothetical protein